MNALIPLSEERTVDNQIQFLQFAIVDTQELTRYMDTKASFVIIILGGIWSLTLPFIPDFKTASSMAWLLRFNYILFVSSLLYASFLAIFCVALLPAALKNIDLAGLPDADQRLLDEQHFFIPNNQSGKLGNNLHRYIQSIRKLDEENIVKILAFEFQKLSFLRNVKAARLRRCFRWMYFLLLHLLVFLATHYYLTQAKSLEKLIGML